MAIKARTGGFPTPQVMIDGAPTVDPLARQAKHDRLAEINAGLSRRLATLRSGVQVSTEQIKDNRE